MHPVSVAANRQTDACLVAAALAGDRPAFGELVSRYQRGARAVCVAVLRDEHLAADAAQEAFVAAYRRLARLQSPGAFGPWLLAICRNEALRLVARNRPAVPLPHEAAARSATSADHADLLAAVASLPEQERAVVMLRFFDGHGAPEIAAMLGRPLGTVTKQLSRAYERLRKVSL